MNILQHNLHISYTHHIPTRIYHILTTYLQIMSQSIVTTTTRLVSKLNSLIEYVSTLTIETDENGTEVRSESTKEYVLEEIDKYGIHIWYNRAGKMHRDGDLPAVIYADGGQVWYKEGNRHRDGDLPAAIYANGDQLWYKEGYRHRDGDLPAAICANGHKTWYKEGMRHRDGDLPAMIDANGDQYWYMNGKQHRDGDLPAVIIVNGNKHWYKDDKLHRDGDLPAIIRPNGAMEYYRNGIAYIPTLPIMPIHKDKLLSSLESLQTVVANLIKEIRT
jgi:hypothetical protein